MSGFNKNSDNQEFIKKLELLRDLEAEKPVEEMDVSLVMACVELILELRGETVNFTPEEVEKKVRKIPFVEETTTLNTPPQSVKGRSTKVKSRKILLIAAIISILIAIFAVTSIPFDWNIFDELKNRFGTVADVPVNEEMEMSGVTVVSNGNSNFYSSVEEALKSEQLDVLYPTNLPSDLKVERISFYQKDGQDKITFAFSDEKLLYSVTLNSSLPNEIKNVAEEVLKINEFECYVFVKSDVHITQIYFEFQDDFYTLNYDDKQDLIEIINNLKESK
jgi:hypothetical protein